MKTITKFSLMLLCIVLLTQSCVKDSCMREETFIKYTPVYKSLSEIRSGIETQSPRNLKDIGKIYFYNDYIFINERREGLHVINNSDARNPRNIAFIAISGTVDMAVRSNVLYVDNYIDLLALDISNPTSVSILHREQDVFPSFGTDNEGRLIVYYDGEEVTEMVDCSNGGRFWGGGLQFDEAVSVSNASGGGSDNAPRSGVGGSMARFTTYADYLYTVDENDLHTFDISTPSTPNKLSTTSVGWGIETIFPHENRLFLGSSNGMFIYDNSNPLQPQFLSQFQHAGACDPVYVKGNYAYVTLRSGTFCDGFTNQLDLVDISNIQQPRLENSFPMDNPHGLSIAGNSLFLCDGESGLKVFDISNPLELDQNKLGEMTGFATYDAIALQGGNKLLMVVGKDGLYQFDYTDPSNLEQLSVITVEK